MNILTGNVDVPHREWGCASPGMYILTGNGMCLTRNAHPHWEWGCASPGMHILTENGKCASPGMHILTGNSHSLYRVKQLSFENSLKSVPYWNGALSFQ